MALNEKQLEAAVDWWAAYVPPEKKDVFAVALKTSVLRLAASHYSGSLHPGNYIKIDLDEIFSCDTEAVRCAARAAECAITVFPPSHAMILHEDGQILHGAINPLTGAAFDIAVLDYEGKPQALRENDPRMAASFGDGTCAFHEYVRLLPLEKGEVYYGPPESPLCASERRPAYREPEYFRPARTAEENRQLVASAFNAAALAHVSDEGMRNHTYHDISVECRERDAYEEKILAGRGATLVPTDIEGVYHCIERPARYEVVEAPRVVRAGIYYETVAAGDILCEQPDGKSLRIVREYEKHLLHFFEKPHRPPALPSPAP